MLRILALTASLLLLSVEAAIDNNNNNNHNNHNNHQPTPFGTSNSGTTTRKSDSDAKRKPQYAGQVTDPNVLERFDHRYPDGSYEFRYELADGTARYERGYFLLFDKLKTLVVVGYYSYRSPDGRYITVFYNADQNGYRQNQSITPQVYPNLPRSIEVPQFGDDPQNPIGVTTARPKPTITTTRRGGRF